MLYKRRAIFNLQLKECSTETWTEVARLALPQSYEENELLFVANSRLFTHLALPVHVTDVNLPIEEDNWKYIYNSTERIWTNWDFNYPGSSRTLVDRCAHMSRETSLWRRHYCTDYNTFACQVKATGLTLKLCTPFSCNYLNAGNNVLQVKICSANG